MANVSITSLKKSYGPVDVLKGISLEVEDGSFVVLVGPSGCGKSTLLRSIAGLEPVNGGSISIAGRVVNDLPPSKREIAMVFQSYALYPHMNVERNMGFGLRFSGVPRPKIDARVHEAARILQLEPLLKRRPRELSGGQRQRVAIGRAIVRKPQVFLFDEPLSNLDAALRVNTRVEIAKLHKLLKATIIYVTHDQVEAMTLADKIVVMNEGRIEQVGKPLDLYYKPANRFVANFIGSPSMNMFDVTVKNSATVETKSGATIKTTVPPKFRPGMTITFGIRPEHVTISKTAGKLSATLDIVERLGELGYAHCEMASGERLIVELRGDAPVERGQTISFTFDEKNVHFFDKN
jgi:ABC-type sugar transport system ATPase subunit